jgi:hypothetical protein
MENKIVKSYYTKTHSSGIIECILNTYDKWIDYYLSYSFNELSITISLDDKYETDKFKLKMENKMKYKLMENQEKDQIVVYFIPYNLIDKEHWLKE